MRYPVDRAAHGLKIVLVCSAAMALASCGVFAPDAGPVAAGSYAPAVNGPQADYPVRIGDPYVVDGKTFTPADVLNYDEVGYVATGSGLGVKGAHHTLPVPSYVEVTSLETGRTILVRLEERGPMDSTHLIALSPAALAQLEASAETPVRVRRVNPPEEQRAMLRAGQSAPLRMDTPMALVNVLSRRLPEEGSTNLRAGSSVPTAHDSAAGPQLASASPEANDSPPALPPLASPRRETVSEAFATNDRPAAAPETAPQPQATGNFVVQAAAFSTAERANRVASDLGGVVSQSGRYYRVRTGPFATRAQAEASLANVRAAGYSDARIFTLG